MPKWLDASQHNSPVWNVKQFVRSGKKGNRKRVAHVTSSDISAAVWPAGATIRWEWEKDTAAGIKFFFTSKRERSCGLMARGVCLHIKQDLIFVFCCKSSLFCLLNKPSKTVIMVKKSFVLKGTSCLKSLPTLKIN